MKSVLSVCLTFFLFSTVYAQGRIVVPESRIQPTPQKVFLQSVKADVKINNGVADITSEQIFFNPTKMRLEGEYIFPLPSEAQIYDFNLYVNGKKTAGEVLDSEEARKIYTDIVRNLRDPALLEYSGYGLFKARIFPIEPDGERKIELSYAQTLSFDSKTFKFVFPIRQSGEGKIENYYMNIDISSDSPISNIYSPSHSIDINQKDAHSVTISLEEKNIEGDQDFVLYYSQARENLDATLLTFRPRNDQDGYFMMMISPVFKDKRNQTIPKDVIFVVDCSGSMKGEKIEQAKNALFFCVKTLKEEDRFEIIKFSSSLESFQDQLKFAGKDEIKNAEYFIKNLKAVGGTNIDAALQKAKQAKDKSDGRPVSIVFLTDGIPTEGETDIKNILEKVNTSPKEAFRIFSFGVGYDVNTFLLDKLSQDTHGSVNYVKPRENIEAEVSRLFSKISDPVLTQPEINWSAQSVNDVYPQKLPDVFLGQRITLFGRYRDKGRGDIELMGSVNNKKMKFEYEVSFPDRESENEFIAKLWAQRKITHLLEQIRFNGENSELVESIADLGKEFGIVTPYTSYLVQEQERELAQVHDHIRSGRVGFQFLRMESKRELREARADIDEESVGSGVSYNALTSAPKAAGGSVGKDAVLESRILKKLATSDKEVNMLLTVQKIAEKTFYLKEGVWVEAGIEFNKGPIRKIKFLSDEYFSLVKNNPQIGRILALGQQVRFSWKNSSYEITS
jgi:Ca-activated chloride channel family protein